MGSNPINGTIVPGTISHVGILQRTMNGNALFLLVYLGGESRAPRVLHELHEAKLEAVL